MTHAREVHMAVDGQPVDARAGQNVLDALLDAGVYVPHLCHERHVDRPGSACRLCFVQVEGQAKPQCACELVAEEGLAISVGTPRCNELARRALELLASEHRADCGTCPRRSSCPLKQAARHLGVPWGQLLGLGSGWRCGDEDEGTPGCSGEGTSCRDGESGSSCDGEGASGFDDEGTSGCDNEGASRCDAANASREALGPDGTAAEGASNSCGIAIDQTKCVLCGRCWHICAREGIGIIAPLGRGADVRVALDETISADDAAFCWECRRCFESCPVGAIRYKCAFSPQG